MQQRLQKIISAAGVASRRAAEKLMTEGRVSVNGQTIRELGSKADPAVDEIRVDDRRIKGVERHRYFLLNKPRGYVTTRSDPEKRPTVLDLLKGVREYVYPVGRLDFDSEGLLILTNDGDLAATLTHPRHEVERVYEVQVLGIPDAHDIERQLIKIVGRKPVVGRPFMYSTTREFLIRFGLRDLTDLPKIEEMAEALGFEVPAGLSQPLQAQLDLGGGAPPEDIEPMSPDVPPGEKIH